MLAREQVVMRNHFVVTLTGYASAEMVTRDQHAETPCGYAVIIVASLVTRDGYASELVGYAYSMAGYAQVARSFTQKIVMDKVYKSFIGSFYLHRRCHIDRGVARDVTLARRVQCAKIYRTGNRTMRQKKRNAASKLANDLSVSICPPVSILPGEDEKAYNELLARVSGTVNPKDAIEEFWVRDVVDMTWEIFRYRGYKAGLIKAAMPEALEEILGPIFMHVLEVDQPDEAVLERNLAQIGGHTKLKELVGNWTAGVPDTLERVNKSLRQCGLTMDDINARAMALVLTEILQVDDLLDRIERSRNALIRDIERQRVAFAEALRQSTKDLDAEAQEVEAEAPALQHAGG